MIKFLKLSYPVVRIREKKHFKRTIIFDTGEKFYLSNKAHLKYLYTKLYNVLELVFCEEKTLTENVLKSFLNMK